MLYGFKQFAEERESQILSKKPREGVDNYQLKLREQQNQSEMQASQGKRYGKQQLSVI